jgi:hypothetical protein
LKEVFGVVEKTDGESVIDYFSGDSPLLSSFEEDDRIDTHFAFLSIGFPRDSTASSIPYRPPRLHLSAEHRQVPSSINSARHEIEVRSNLLLPLRLHLGR